MNALYGLRTFVHLHVSNTFAKTQVYNENDFDLLLYRYLCGSVSLDIEGAEALVERAVCASGLRRQCDIKFFT